MTRYRVEGLTNVLGHPPGSVFEAELDEAQERRLLAAGTLSKARANAKVRDVADDHDDSEGGE